MTSKSKEWPDKPSPSKGHLGGLWIGQTGQFEWNKINTE